MKTILPAIILILAAIDLRNAYKIKDLEERIIEAFRILCRKLDQEQEEE